jgi:hypothetical protein
VLDAGQLLGQAALIALDAGAGGTRRWRRRAGTGLCFFGCSNRGLKILEGQLTLVFAKLLGALAVEDLPELRDQMLEPTVVLGQRRDVGLQRQPPRALGLEGGAQLGRQDGQVDRNRPVAAACSV